MDPSLSLLLPLLFGQDDLINTYFDARHPDQGGTGRIDTAPVAPGEGYYRLVPGLDEALRSLLEGEPPVVYTETDQWPGLGASEFERLRAAQYNGTQYNGVESMPPMFLPRGDGGFTLNPYFIRE